MRATERFFKIYSKTSTVPQLIFPKKTHMAVFGPISNDFEKNKCNVQQNYAAETMGGVQGGPKHAKKAKIHEKTQKSRAVFSKKATRDVSGHMSNDFEKKLAANLLATTLWEPEEGVRAPERV